MGDINLNEVLGSSPAKIENENDESNFEHLPTIEEDNKEEVEQNQPTLNMNRLQLPQSGAMDFEQAPDSDRL